MKSITLRSYEVRQLQETGEVLVVRLIKPQPVARTPNDFCFLAGDYAWRAKGWRSGTVSVSNKPGGPDGFAQANCPLGTPTERRWVRETWAYGVHAMASTRDEEGPFVYAATNHGAQGRLCDRWRSPVTMPRRPAATRSRLPRSRRGKCRRSTRLRLSALASIRLCTRE